MVKITKEDEKELRDLLGKNKLNKEQAYRVKDLAFNEGFNCAITFMRNEWKRAKTLEEFEKILNN